MLEGSDRDSRLLGEVSGSGPANREPRKVSGCGTRDLIR